MPSDKLVHPQKIYQMFLMCSCSHHSIYQLIGQATIMTSTWATLCWLPKAYDEEPSLQTSYQGLEVVLMEDPILRHTLQIMHNHLSLMADLCSHLCTQWLTLILTHVSLMHRQCQVPLHWLDSWHLTTHSSSLTCILSQTPVPIFWPCYIYRSSWYLGDMTAQPYGPTQIMTRG